MVVAALNIAAGVVVLKTPEASAEALAMFAALLFLTGGLFRLVGSLVVRGPQFGWTLVQGASGCSSRPGAGQLAQHQSVRHRHVPLPLPALRRLGLIATATAGAGSSAWSPTGWPVRRPRGRRGRGRAAATGPPNPYSPNSSPIRHGADRNGHTRGLVVHGRSETLDIR
ncbi:hypothetical protein GCM10023238_30930 [Streptomyces heliomycini]